MAQRDSGTAPYNARTKHAKKDSVWATAPYRPGKTRRKRSR